MVTQDQRRQLIVEFVQSYRSTGQLLFKMLQATMQEKSACNMACLPILKTLKQQGSMTQSAIAREIHHSDAAVSRQIGILVEDGLVDAKPDKQNRRATLIKLTQSGENLLGELEATVTDFLTDAFAEITDLQLRESISNNHQLQEAMLAHTGKEPRV